MSDTEDKTNDAPARAGGIGPGERLQAARIKNGLSLEDVANRMHLSSSILEALEDNNFDEITAPIFVKGYLRAYARIVSLSEDEMIEQYIDFYSEEDPPISSTSNMAPELSPADTRIKWTTYLVILLLAVLLAAWWWNKQQNQDAPVSLDVQSSSIDDSAATDPVVDSGIQAGSETQVPAETTGEVSGPDAAIATDEAVVVGVDSSAEADPVVTDTASAELVETEQVETEQVETQQVETEQVETGQVETEQVETGQVAMPEAAEPAEPAVDEGTTSLESDTAAVVEVEPVAGTREQPEQSAPAGSDKLQIIVHADTWADVKDSNNYQLVYDLLRADSSLELSGQAPFTVFLGNGHGVEIMLNGEEVGFAARIRDDNTARLNVGG
jgi:cytoskeleton protein RodZ